MYSAIECSISMVDPNPLTLLYFEETRSVKNKEYVCKYDKQVKEFQSLYSKLIPGWREGKLAIKPSKYLSIPIICFNFFWIVIGHI